ncbi:uncharacterized protein LOC102702586 isoform X1 [Oryza brachyantha]|nr:uncharacterized protein LOC102702586 isoform X1 [Oryza brachyantha]
MFDDDDDVEPPVSDVDNYYFEKSEDDPVCFSVLPIKFDENEEVRHCDYKEVNLRGVTDNNLKEVFKKVVAWRVELDCQEPKISVLSSEGKWIELLKPRKSYYEKRARSILITVQMLHFVRKWPRKQERSLFCHLTEVLEKFGTRPTRDDIIKNHRFIKLFMERDQILMKSKIIGWFIEDASRKDIKPIPRRENAQEQFIVSDESLESSDNSDVCSYSNYDDSDDYSDGRNSDDNDDNNTDKDTDADTGISGNAVDDGTDMICAICDDGGWLLDCEGQCKSSFHPTVNHGKKSNCRTLRFTSAELKLKESGTFLCKNCEHNEHQCFKCGELEPSCGPNAKVFQCNKESCGHFYHPKCIAVLLEPEDTNGACKLEERIADGMPFTCPVHWCFKCGKMEDRTQKELQFAVCRRCPRSYHIECLPSEVSFEKKGKGAPKLAWKIKTRCYFYCLHHGIDATTGTPHGEHIKFPSVPKIKKTKKNSKKDFKVIGKRKKSANKISTKSKELENLSPTGEIEETRRVAKNSSSEHITLKHGYAVKRLKKDLQFELPMVDVAANLSGAKTMEGKEEPPVTPKIASCVVDGETEKSVTSMAGKETSVGTSQDMATRSGLRQPSRIEAVGMLECSVQIADKLHWYVQPGDTIVDLCFNMDNFSQLMEDKLEAVGKSCNFKNYDLFQHKKDMCFEESNWVTMQPKDLPHGSNLVMVLDPPLGIQAVSANKFVDKVLTFKPRLIIIVSPTDIDRLDCKEEPYHLIWDYNQHIFGKPLYQPGDVDVNDEGKNGLYAIPLSLSLWSCPDKAEENRRIARKHGHLNVGYKTHSVILKDPLVNKGAKWDNEIFTAGKEDTSEREHTSKRYSGEQLTIPSEDTFHANQEQNDVLQSLHREKHADGSESGNKSGSGKQSDMHWGENECGHYSVAQQEKEISKREERMTDSKHEENTRSGKEEIPRDDNNKGTMKPHRVDGLPPEKHVEVAFVNKTTTDRVDTQQECGYNVTVDVNGSYAHPHEPKSPYCNGNIKGTEMDTSGDNSRRGQKEVTDAKRLDLDRKRKPVHMKNRRDAHHGDDRTAHPQVHNDPPCVDNRMPDVLDYPSRSGINSPSRNDDQRAVEASVCSKSRERWGSNRRLEARDTISKNSHRHRLPVGKRNRRNVPDRSNNYPPGWGRVDDSENYPTTSNRHRYEQIHHGDSGPTRSHRSNSHPRAEYGNRRSSSPWYTRRQYYSSAARHRSPPYVRMPRGSGVGYETDWNAVPHRGNSPDTEYNGTVYNSEYGIDGYATDSRYGYCAMENPRVDRYHHPQEYHNEHATVYDRRRNDYGGVTHYRSGNSFSLECRSSARGTVTDRYAPSLERTNHQIPGQGSLQDDFMYDGRNSISMDMHRPYW